MIINRITLNSDKKIRLRLLKTLRNQNSNWKLRRTLFIVMNLISVCIILGTAIYAFTPPVDSFAQSGFVVLLSVVPATVTFIIGYLPWYYGRYTYTYPYGGRVNEHLILNDDSLTYFYWFVNKGQPSAYGIGGDFPAGQEFVYSIPKENIKEILFDENSICHIIGQGYLQVPQNTFTKGDQAGIYEKYSFLVDFVDDDPKRIILNWWNDNG